MEKRYRVSVVKIRRIQKLRVQDTETGRRWLESTGQKIRRKAERLAAEREEELNRPTKPGAVTWKELAGRYITEVLETKTTAYRAQFECAVAKVVPPPDSTGINQEWVNRAVADVNRAIASKSSVASYLKCIRAFLNWVHELGHCPKLRIRIPSVPTSDAARGEPLTEPQFKAIKKAVPLVVDYARAKSFQQFLTGLWLSGFRIDELFRLTWDDLSEIHIRHFDSPTPLVVFPQGKSKGTQREAELWPIPPDFVEHLKLMGNREGRVYGPLSTKLVPFTHSSSVGKIISQISTRAGITVTGGDGSLRYASANDLRRSFVQRWYVITKDILLAQQMARHKNPVVTTRFYAKQRVADLRKRICSSYQQFTLED